LSNYQTEKQKQRPDLIGQQANLRVLT